MRNINIVITVIALMAVVSLIFLILQPAEQLEPEVIEIVVTEKTIEYISVTEYIEVPVIEYRTITNTVDKIVYRDKVIDHYIEREIQPFESVTQLENWLARHNTASVNGITYLDGLPTGWDCDDWAMYLGIDLIERHIRNLAIIGNGIYAVDYGKITWVCEVD